MHTQVRRRKVSDYGIQLRAKQRARRIYFLLEGQFRLYFNRAAKMSGVTGLNLLRLLESRLDNVVYRLGFAASRRDARQLVSHKHIAVNGKTVNIPSYSVRVGDEIRIRDGSKEIERIKTAAEIAKQRTLPNWLSVDHEQLTAKVVSQPVREDIDQTIQEQLIVEFYSR
jgi:small subunit ribosomal protein S4